MQSGGDPRELRSGDNEARRAPLVGYVRNYGYTRLMAREIIHGRLLLVMSFIANTSSVLFRYEVNFDRNRL